MQQPGVQERQQRHRIVVPSRSDRLLKEMTELVGGPMGRRAAPGIVSPGFFTVERVLILMALASAIVAFFGKFHCQESGWTTPDQYSTVCWSQFPNIFVDSQLSSNFPFFSANGTFSFPPLTGLIAGVTAWLVGGAGTLAAQQLAFFDLNAALIGVAWLATVAAVARSARRRPWDAAIVAASPALLLTAYVSWDFWAAALVSVGILLFARRRTLWAGLVIGLAATIAPYALLVLFVLLVLAVRGGQAVRAIETIAAAAVGWLAVVGPVLLVNPAQWGKYLSRVFTATPSDSSIYGSYNLVAQRVGLVQVSGGTVNGAVFVLLLVLLLAVVWLGLAAPRRPRVAQLAFLAVAGLTLIDKSAQPWHGVWLLPLLALAHPRWRTMLLWQATVIAHFIALMLFQSTHLGDISPQHSIDMPYFVFAVLLNMVATLAVMILVVRDVLTPEYDVVRRKGVDDPQGGILDGTPDHVAIGRGRLAGERARG